MSGINLRPWPIAAQCRFLVAPADDDFAAHRTKGEYESILDVDG